MCNYTCHSCLLLWPVFLPQRPGGSADQLLHPSFGAQYRPDQEPAGVQVTSYLSEELIPTASHGEVYSVVLVTVAADSEFIFVYHL